MSRTTAGDLPETARARLGSVLGAISAFGPDARFDRLPPDRRRRAMATGTRLADDWEAALDRFLDETMQRFLAGKGDWSDRKLLGALYDWFEADGSGPVFGPVRDRVVRWARANLPMGPERTFLGSTVERRVVHSVHSFHEEERVHPKRLRKLLLASGVIDESTNGLSDGRTLFKAADAEAVRRQLVETMTLKAAAAYLNAPRPHERLLLEHGFIAPVVAGSKTGDTKHAFAKGDLDAFLADLGADASTVFDGSEDVHPIPTAAKRANCSAVEIVRLLLDRQLGTVRRDPEAEGYLSVRVDPAEVLKLVRRPDHGCLSLREATRALGTDDGVVNRLVEMGHLPHREVVNPVKRNAQRAIDPKDLEAFGARYVSLAALSREAGEHAPRLLERLRQQGVEAAFDREAVGATFFERAACMRFLLAHGSEGGPEGHAGGPRP